MLDRVGHSVGPVYSVRSAGSVYSVGTVYSTGWVGPVFSVGTVQ